MSIANVDPKLDLVLERVVDVAPELVWDAWTRPALVKQWFTPAPWQTVACEIELRRGGIFRTVMRSSEGKDFPHVGCFLEVVPKERLVFTDALSPGYRPSGEPFMTAVISMTPQGLGTRYVARALHADEAGRKRHEEMGFEAGWAKALDQLVAVVKAM